MRMHNSLRRATPAMRLHHPGLCTARSHAPSAIALEIRRADYRVRFTYEVPRSVLVDTRADERSATVPTVADFAGSLNKRTVLCPQDWRMTVRICPNRD